MGGLGHMGNDRKAEVLITRQLCKVEEAKLKTFSGMVKYHFMPRR